MSDVLGRPNSRRKIVPIKRGRMLDLVKKHEIIAISSTSAPKIAPTSAPRLSLSRRESADGQVAPDARYTSRHVVELAIQHPRVRTPRYRQQAKRDQNLE
jgi:hypothetical protein